MKKDLRLGFLSLLILVLLAYGVNGLFTPAHEVEGSLVGQVLRIITIGMYIVLVPIYGFVAVVGLGLGFTDGPTQTKSS